MLEDSSRRRDKTEERINELTGKAGDKVVRAVKEWLGLKRACD